VVPRRIAPSSIIQRSRYHSPVTVRLTPPTPPRQPRLEHVRDLWKLHRPRKPQAILTAVIFQTDIGLELRIGFSLTNLIHSELSRKGDAPLLARAADLRQVLIEQG
jgi:hypothetical protein